MTALHSFRLRREPSGTYVAAAPIVGCGEFVVNGLLAVQGRVMLLL
mgnify:CR=1 FL=1